MPLWTWVISWADPYARLVILIWSVYEHNPSLQQHQAWLRPTTCLSISHIHKNMTFWNQKVLHMSILIIWFTNTSTTRQHWFSRPGWDLTHTCLQRADLWVWTGERWEKCTSIFHPSCWDDAGYLFKHTLWLHASGKLVQEVHSLAAAPPWPGKYSQRLKAFRRMICLLGKVAVTEIQNDKCWVCEEYNCASFVTVLCYAVSVLSLYCTLTSIVSVMKINNPDYL